MSKRKKVNMGIVVLFILYVCLSAGGLILFKLGSGDLRLGYTMDLLTIQFSWKMLFGIMCYAASFLLWLFIVSKVNLSYAMPLSVGLVNLLVLVGSNVILKEPVNVMQWTGAIVVVIGLAIINVGGNV